MIKRYVYIIAASALFVAVGWQASSASEYRSIHIWHSNSLYSGFGRCSARLTIDSNDQHIEGMEMKFSVQNANGEEILNKVATVDELGFPRALRYTEIILEHEELCDKGLIIRVTSATATVDGESLDLVGAGLLVAREFHPARVEIGF